MNTIYIALAILSVIITIIAIGLKKNKRGDNEPRATKLKEGEDIKYSGSVMRSKDYHYARVPARNVPIKGVERKHKGMFFVRKKKKR